MSLGLVILLGMGLSVVLPIDARSTAGSHNTGRDAASRTHTTKKHKKDKSTTTVTATTARTTTTTKATATTASSTTTTAATTAQAASGLEFGVNWHAGWDSYSSATNRAIVDKMAAAGVTWARIDLGWAEVFPEGPTATGQWYIDKVDRAVDYANSRGINVLGIWMYTPSWANGGKGRFDPPTHMADYAKSAQWAANHWKGRIQAWEVWNEPDLEDTFWHGTQDQYVELLKAAYPAFHLGDPGTTVVLAGPSSNDDEWIQGIYSRGGKDFFDVVATHPYQGKANEPPERPDDGNRWWFSHLPAVRDVMVRNGDSAKKIWLTEFGWSSHANTGGEKPWQLGVSEQQQADYLVRAIRYAKANYPYVNNMMWYQVRNESCCSTHNNNFGLLYGNLTDKPAYTALRTALGH